MKKLLLLGGSQQQLVAIETAKSLGYYTVVCDYLIDNPGQFIADVFYLVSTTDIEAVLKIANKEQVNGVISYASDPAALTAAYVSEELGLPGHSIQAVDTLTDKAKFRKFLYENDFKTPKSGSFHELQELQEEIHQYRLPLIIKPVDSSGSKGVSMLESTGDLAFAFANAKKYSRQGRIIVEEYVEMKGYQVAGDGFAVNGELIFRCYGNDHFDSSAANPFVPVSASFPLDMDEKIYVKIDNEIQRLFDSIKIGTGAFNFDIRISDTEDVYLMEVGPRNGGNYIPQVIEHATGVNLVELSIKAAMGDSLPSLKTVDPKGYYSYYVVHSNYSGILKNVQIEADIKNNHIISMHWNKSVGDKIEAFKGSNSAIGILLMKFTSMNQMLMLMDENIKWISVEVDQ